MKGDFIVTVKDSDGEIIRYEDQNGQVIATMEEEKPYGVFWLTLTDHGYNLGYFVVNNKLVWRDTWVPIMFNESYASIGDPD